ncbi:hypothetical protein [Streptomyces cuspidosporus]|uniref:Uncharacterized protein n=1 Tax=Streptomyces cuspidosporus TaxID=66882 RepID=A0ABN3FIW8_9ACTN
MTTDPTPRHDDEHQELRQYVRLLALGMVLLIVVATVYLTYQHPALGAPFSSGSTIAAALVGLAGLTRGQR